MTSNDAARLVTAIIALWDEITWRYQLLIEHRSSSVVFSSPVPDDYKQLVAFGYGIGVSVGQIDKFGDSDEEEETKGDGDDNEDGGTIKGEIDFLQFVNFPRRCGHISEPEGKPLCSRIGSSGGKKTDKKSQGQAPEFRCTCLCFVSPNPLPPTLPERRKPELEAKRSEASAGPAVITPQAKCSVDSVDLTDVHARKLVVLITRFDHDLYQNRKAPSHDDMNRLWASPDAYSSDFKQIFAKKEHAALSSWYWTTLNCKATTKTELEECSAQIRVQLEMDLFRHSPNPKRPWSYAQAQWAKFLRDLITPQGKCTRS